MSRFEVGQTVIVTDVNYKGFKEATVTKVGSKLVYVDRDVYGRENSAFRIQDGLRNDKYQHGRIQTVDAFREAQERAELIASLGEEGVRFDNHPLVPTDRLKKIMEVFK